MEAGRTQQINVNPKTGMVNKLHQTNKELSMGDQVLIGIKEIEEYARRNWRVIKVLIDTKGFPAVKVGGRWESDPELIKQWRQEQITNARKSS